MKREYPSWSRCLILACFALMAAGASFLMAGNTVRADSFPLTPVTPPVSPVSPIFVTQKLPFGWVGIPYSAIIAAVDKQGDKMAINLTGMPEWMTNWCYNGLGSAYCELKGTPDKTGIYTIKAIARDKTGNRTVKKFRLAITLPPQKK